MRMWVEGPVCKFHMQLRVSSVWWVNIHWLLTYCLRRVGGQQASRYHIHIFSSRVVEYLVYRKTRPGRGYNGSISTLQQVITSQSIKDAMQSILGVRASTTTNTTTKVPPLTNKLTIWPEASHQTREAFSPRCCRWDIPIINWTAQIIATTTDLRFFIL